MTIKISYQNQNKTIRLSELPVFEEATVTALKKTDAVKKSQILINYNYQLTNTLKGRAESIETVRTALNEIEEHKTREVIYACLKTAVACVVIAGIVLGAVFGPGELALVIALIVAILGASISSYITEKSFNNMKQFNQIYYWDVTPFKWSGFYNPICLITAPFMPLGEVLTRQARIKCVQNNQEKEINSGLSNFLEFTEELSKNLEKIRQELNANKKKIEEHINESTPFLEIPLLKQATEASIIKLETDLDAIQKTQEVLNAIEAYASKMQT